MSSLWRNSMSSSQPGTELVDVVDLDFFDLERLEAVLLAGADSHREALFHLEAARDPSAHHSWVAGRRHGPTSRSG